MLIVLLKLYQTNYLYLFFYFCNTMNYNVYARTFFDLLVRLVWLCGGAGFLPGYSTCARPVVLQCGGGWAQCEVAGEQLLVSIFIAPMNLFSGLVSTCEIHAAPHFTL